MHVDFLEMILGKWEPHFLRMILQLILYGGCVNLEAPGVHTAPNCN